MVDIVKQTISEREFQKWVLEAFEQDSNIIMWRNNTGVSKMENKRFVRFGAPGSADIIGIVKHFRCKSCNASQDGVFLAIELKSEKGKPTNKQTEWLNQVSQYNGIAILLFPEEKDPIGLRERIEKMIYSMVCPRCYEKSKIQT